MENALTLNSRHALEEFLANIRSNDLVKARIVVSYFDGLDEAQRLQVISELEKCPADFSLPLLVYLFSCHRREVVRLKPDMSGIIFALATDNPEIVVRSVRLSQPEQYYHIRLCGRLRLGRAVEPLTALLMTATDTRLLKETLVSLGHIGDPVVLDGLSEYLYAQSPELVFAAVEALGRIATPEAMERLAERLGRDEEVDVLILDVFAMVQDGISLKNLNEVLSRGSSALRNYAKVKLTEIGAKALPLLASNLFSSDGDLIIHSLNILGDIGDDTSAMSVRKLLNTHPRNANVRFAAYETLSRLPRLKGDYVLASGLTDGDDNVRLAAARAIDHNLDPLLAAGIRNLVRKGDGEATRIIKAVVDSQAGRLFIFLLEVDFFRKVAIDYLGCKVHPELKTFFLDLCRKEGMIEPVEEILSRTAESAAVPERMTICAVDDSKMVLHVYRSVLTELGFEPVLFDNPLKALAWLKEEKPLLLCTDLNMPELTGIDMIRQVRRWYDKNALPVVMVTTQNDLEDKRDAYRAGIDAILAKPFNAAEMGRVFAELLDRQGGNG